MQGNHFTITYHTAGSLAANHVVKFKLPFDCQLEYVSAVGSNANNGIIDIGPSTDTDGYLDGKDIGDSGVPAEFGQDDFVGGEFPHIVAGTIIVASLDYDGAGGTATQDYTLVMVFSEG
jgi:hypothetical protein